MMTNRFQRWLFAAFVPLGLLLVVLSVMAYRALREGEAADARVDASEEALRSLRSGLMRAVALEAHQRSYLLTDAPVYYTRFTEASDSLRGFLDTLSIRFRPLIPSDPRYSRYIALLRERLALAGWTIETRLREGNRAALGVVRSNRGLAIMDSLRSLEGALEKEQIAAVVAYRARGSEQTTASLTALIAGCSLSLVVLAGAFVLLLGFERRRIKTEGLLHASEAFAKGIIDSAPDIIARMTREGIIESLNPAFHSVTGLETGEWIGKDFGSLVNGADPSLFRAKLQQAVAGRSTEVFQINLRKKQNGIVLGECTLTPQKRNGAVEGIIGIVRDSTERIQASVALRESEERLRRVVGSVPISLWAIDTLGIVTLLEGKGLSHFGLQPGELVGQLAFDFIAKDESVRNAIRRALGGEDVVENATIGERSFDIRYSPIRTEGGPVQGVLVIALDVTERVLAAQERERLIEELQEALANVKTLSGLIPICASCKKIRDDSGYWNNLESYIAEHSDAQFSHGICPECAAKLYPEFFKPKQS